MSSRLSSWMDLIGLTPDKYFQDDGNGLKQLNLFINFIFAYYQLLLKYRINLRILPA